MPFRPLASRDKADGFQSMGVVAAEHRRPETQAATEPSTADLEAQAHAEQLALARAEAEAARAQVQALAMTLEQATLEVQALRAEMLRQASQDVAALLRAVLERVLTAGFQQTDVVCALIEESLSSFPDTDKVTIRVPSSCAEELQSMLYSMADQIQPDPSLTGGCVVETRNTAIESTVEAALTSLNDVLDRWDEP